VTWLEEGAILICLLICALVYSLATAINLPTWHLEGAFQTASSLFRLDAGQCPGKDFFPYLGIGPFLTLFPAFKASGSTLAASVFSAQFMTLVSWGISVAVIWQFIFRPQSFVASLAAGSFFLLTIIVSATYFRVSFDVSPGNSLRPVRSALPYLVAIIYYLIIERLRSTKLQYGFSGVLTGTLLLWSNDFAIPCCTLFTFFVVFRSIKSGEFSYENMAIYTLSCFLSSVAFMHLATAGHSIAYVRYNLDLAHDQWWFFGPYGESTRIFAIRDICRLFAKETILAVGLLAAVAAYSVKSRRLEHQLLAWIGLILLTGGVIPSIGGHLGGYFGAFHS
jgi:hypothetical protein